MDGKDQEAIGADERDFFKIEQKFTKHGYAEGAAEGHENAFQSSFDVGYIDGFRTGFNLGQIESFYQTITPEKCECVELLCEREQFKAMHLPPVNDAQHSQYAKHSKESLTCISSRQKSYIDGIMSNLKDDLPRTMTLLHAPRK